MPTFTPNALRLFFASSAITLFTNFEPVWARVESRSTVWNEQDQEEEENETSHVFSELAVNRHHGNKSNSRGRRPIKGRLQTSRSDIDSNIDNDADAETKTNIDGRLKNMAKAFRQHLNDAKTCNPDLGILSSCDVGEYCQKISSGRRPDVEASRGLCVPLQEAEDAAPFMHQTDRKLQAPCPIGSVALDIYMEYDNYSSEDTYWGLIDLTLEDLLTVDGFPDEGPVVGPYCVDISNSVLELFVCDYKGDGLTVNPSGCGLSVAVAGQSPFISQPTSPFLTLGDGCVKYCFACPAANCCYATACYPLPIINGAQCASSKKKKSAKAGGKGGAKGGAKGKGTTGKQCPNQGSIKSAKKTAVGATIPV